MTNQISYGGLRRISIKRIDDTQSGSWRIVVDLVRPRSGVMKLAEHAHLTFGSTLQPFEYHVNRTFSRIPWLTTEMALQLADAVIRLRPSASTQEDDDNGDTSTALPD